MQPSSIALLILGAGELFAAFRGFSLYKGTHIREYLYFALLWICAATTSFTSVAILEGTPTLVLFQIRELSFIFFFLSLFFHALRRLFTADRLPLKILTVIGWLITLALIITTLLWKELPQMNLTIPPEPDFNQHFGIQFGPIVYSNLYPLPRNLLGFLSFILTFIAYFFVSSETEQRNARRALVLWRITAFSGFFWSFFQTFWFLFFSSPSIRLIFALLAIIPLSIITFVFPEGFISSYAQIYRAAQAYRFIDEKEEPQIDELHTYIMEVAKITQKLNE